MKKVAVSLLLVVAVVFFGVETALAGVSTESSPSFLAMTEELQTLQYCEETFLKYEEVIKVSLENSDSDRLSTVARDFLMMAEESYDGSYNLEGQYFMYVRINLWTCAEGLRGNKVSADKKETLDRLRVGLNRVLKKYNMKLPLPVPPKDYFEKAESGNKCFKCD